MEAKAAEERGHRLRAQAQLAQAADAYNEALSAWVSPQEPDREAVCRLRLGDVLRMMGRLEEAEVQYEKARGIHQARGNALGIADAIECQGDLTRAAGRWDRALELYGAAARIYQDLPDGLVGVTNTSHSMGEVSLVMSGCAVADDHYREALRTATDAQSREMLGSDWRRSHCVRGIRSRRGCGVIEPNRSTGRAMTRSASPT